MKQSFWMKGRKFLLSLVFSVMCSEYAEGNSMQTHSSLGLHFLIEGDGVSLSRNRHTGYIPVSSGAEVQRGDMIKPKKGQVAKILCSDFSLHILKRESPCPCSNKEFYEYDGYKVYRPMGAGLLTSYILHPRRTAILTPEPFLKWYNTGARSYTVKIADVEGNVIWQEKNVEQNQIRYPGNPRLQAGKNYLLLAIDNDTGDSSSNDPMKGLGFQLLNDETIKTIEAHKLKIQALDLSKESQAFAIALYFATRRYGELAICGDALALLDSISSDMPTPAVHLWRGHMYGKMRLNNEAEKAYTQALELAKATGDLYIQAEANGGLWCVTNKQTYQDDAKQLYNELGESEPKFVCKKQSNRQ